MSYIEIKNLSKIYNVAGKEIKALNDVSFSVNKGELVCILGSSGAGKSTLLNILGGMDTKTTGTYKIEDELVSEYNSNKLTKFRRESIGFIFQFYNLMPNLTALENILLSSSMSKDSKSSLEVLSLVGLGDRKDHFPSNLSGGEQQRVAIARALVKSPKLLLCDEPTGALDSKTGANILELLSNMARVEGKTVIIVTHNSLISEISDRVIKLHDGKIVSNEFNNNPKKCSDIIW